MIFQHNSSIRNQSLSSLSQNEQFGKRSFDLKDFCVSKSAFEFIAGLNSGLFLCNYIINCLAPMIQGNGREPEVQRQLFTERQALEISETKLKVSPKLRNIMHSLSRILFWDKNNFLIWTNRNYYNQGQKYRLWFYLVSQNGDEIHSYEAKGFCIRLQMPTKKIVFFLEQKLNNQKLQPQNYILTQWNLQDNEIVHLNLQVSHCQQMFTFPDSSLICISGIQTRFQKQNNQEKRVFMFSLSYYRFPLKENENKPIKKYWYVPKALDPFFYCQKLDNQSMILISTKRQDRESFKMICTCTIEQGVKSNQFKFFEKFKSFDIRQLKQNLFFLTQKQIQGNYKKCILTEKDGKPNLTQLSFPQQGKELFFQLTDCFKNTYVYRFAQSGSGVIRYYINFETRQVLGKIYPEKDQMWWISVCQYDHNMEIWSKYDSQAGQFSIKKVSLGQLRFERKIIFAFLLMEYLPQFDDDLYQLALKLILEKL